MKHLRTISRGPSKAQSLTPGQILTILAELLGVLSSIFVTKEGGGTSA